MSSIDIQEINEVTIFLNRFIKKLKHKHHEKFFNNIFKKHCEYVKYYDIINIKNPTYIDYKSDVTETKFNHIIDWFNSDGMETYKSHGIKNLDNAVTLADKWFIQQLKKHTELGANDYNIVYTFPDGYKWVQLLTVEALDYESKYMQNCVGGGSYDDNIVDPKYKYYSLRDPFNRPHVTIEHYKDTINQVKGKQNVRIIKNIMIM